MKRILIVDDDKSILEALRIAVEIEGYDVDTLSNGEEVYNKVLDDKPDLILLDLLLSGIDGSDIVKKIRKDKVVKSVPIIMISAHPKAEKIALEAGANAFVAKPFDLDDLMKAISAYA